jgi:hypothetical protein
VCPKERPRRASGLKSLRSPNNKMNEDNELDHVMNEPMLHI